MPVQSYLVYPRENMRSDLISKLSNLNECEVLESTNEELLILLTDTQDSYAEGMLQEELKLIPEIQGISLVFAQEG